jgi:hypothetical protein
MDLQKTIQELQFRKQQLDRTIAELEQLQKREGGDRVAVQAKRRGRKSMGPEERQDVSRRMRHYWATRRTDCEQDKL